MPHWRIKASMLKIMSAFPGGHRLNFIAQTAMRSMQSREGWMKNTERVIQERAPQIHWISKHLPIKGARVLDVGTGWQPMPTLLFYLAGAESIITCDIVRHVRFRLAIKLLESFERKTPEIAEAFGVPVDLIRERLDRIKGAKTLDEYFRRANIQYLAPSDAAATGLPSQSIDIWFAFGVLQYVPVQQLRPILCEAKRVLKPSGRLYCAVGYYDDFAQFDKGLFLFDYLRYNDAEWQRLAGNGLYTANRLREPEYFELFEQLGGVLEDRVPRVEEEHIERVRNMRVADRFQKFTPEQNAIVASELLYSFPK
jgi:SAM-dependent methyltransferase